MALKKKFVGNVRELVVYKKALLFCKAIYTITEAEAFESGNLGEKLRKSACAVVANIAEGNTNFYYKKEYDHLNTALSKIAVSRSLIDVAKMQCCINQEVYRKLDSYAEEIVKMLIALLNRIERSVASETPRKKPLKLTNPLNLSSVTTKATQLNQMINDILKKFPKSEDYNMIDQLFRASQSIVDNLSHADGCFTLQDTLKYLNTSLGSTSEIQSFITISVMTNIITKEEYRTLDVRGEEILTLLYKAINDLEEMEIAS